MNLLHTVFWYLLITVCVDSFHSNVNDTIVCQVHITKKLPFATYFCFRVRIPRIYFLKNNKNSNRQVSECGWFYFECNNNTSERCVSLADLFVRFDGCFLISVIESVPKKDVENVKQKTTYKSRIFCFTLTKNISVRDNDLKKRHFTTKNNVIAEIFLTIYAIKFHLTKKKYVYEKPH